MVPELDTSPSEHCASAAVVFGLVSLAVCWWFPFGGLLGVAGGVLGLLAWYGGKAVERALVGTALAACGVITAVLLGWDYWQRVFGL